MDADTIAQHIRATFPGVEVVAAAGDSFFFCGPERKMPFATLVTGDNHDKASDLNRPGVYRLNVGVVKETYRSLFGPQPAMVTTADEVVDTGHDFTALDQIMPHPVYAAMSWICVLNPGPATFERVKELLAEAHALASRRGEKRTNL